MRQRQATEIFIDALLISQRRKNSLKNQNTFVPQVTRLGNEPGELGLQVRYKFIFGTDLSPEII